MSAKVKSGSQHSTMFSAAEIAENFGDLHPPLSGHEAVVAADRCYFCYDAPCVTACPTAIDIPMFIRQIANENAMGAAETIFDKNILGGMCARVCPTETLCEEACVRMEAEGKPVLIGQLQRHATDLAMTEGRQFYQRSSESGKSVAVVGAGPAGLACAHRLATHGHSVTIHEARPKSGGLNEYGIAAYKSVDNFAQAEVDYVLSIGGIDVVHNSRLGRDIDLPGLMETHDAVFIGCGLDDVNDLGLGNGNLSGLRDAVDFIEDVRQADDLSSLKVGDHVVVIGGGMTAIDAAVQAKLLGAREVTILYRRGKDQMNASEYEQDLATSKGVVIRHWSAPKELVNEDGALTGLVVERMALSGDKLGGTGETETLVCDQLFSAIGQKLIADDVSSAPTELKIDNGRIAVDKEGHTSVSGIWAGGDCCNQGEDLTVTAVAQGRDAAESIHAALVK